MELVAAVDEGGKRVEEEEDAASVASLLVFPSGAGMLLVGASRVWGLKLLASSV